MSDNLEITAINLERDIAFSVADDRHRRGMRRGAIFLGSVAAAFAGLMIIAAVSPGDAGSQTLVSSGDQQAPPQRSLLARVPHSADGAWVLACRSANEFIRLAPTYMMAFTTESDAAENARYMIARLRNRNQCDELNDRARSGEFWHNYHIYRVDRVEDELACVWVLSDERGGCFWTGAANLMYIGHGQQLSEDQFRDARTLYAQARELRKLSNDYILQAQIIKDRQGDRQEEAQLRALAKHADDQGDEVEEQISRIQPTDRDPAGNEGSQTSSPAPLQNDADFSGMGHPLDPNRK